MKIDRHYLITALPSSGELGSTPPMSFAQLIAHVEAQADRRELVGAVLLLDDLVQREAFLAGEIEEVEPAVLTAAQVRNESPLPEYLAAETERVAGVEADAVWEAYFRHVADVARRQGSNFLAAWVGSEVALRNALASARAKRLGLDEADYLVAVDLAGDEDYANLVSEWAAAPTPLAGQRVLIAARWAWLAEHDAWFTFKDDELAAYAVRLMLLH